MTSSNYRKHARKVSLDSAVNKAIEKAVDARKVAAFTVGAAGVLAGAAFAFGATPAIAAETGAAAKTNPAPVTADEKAGAGKKDDAGKNADAKPVVKETVAKDSANQEQTGDKDQTEANKEAGDTNKQAEKKVESDKKEDANKPEEKKQTEQSVAKTEDKKSDENQKQEATVVGTDREASAAPESKPQANSTIKLSKDTKDTLPNMYAWGKSDNVYIEEGQNTSVTFTFAKPDDGYTITKVAIFPSDGNSVDNDKSRKYLEYYSASDEHQPYSGTYAFKVNDSDGTATLTMTKLYNDGNLKSGESHSANRCIYVYGKDKNGNTVVLYKTNIVRAATLIPPKNAGSIVLEYDQTLTEDQIQAKLKQALDAPTEATGNKSIREQITAASKSKGVGVRNEAAKTFTNTPDDPDKKIVITDQRAYDVNQFNRINKATSQQGAAVTTYTTGVQNLKTYLVSDLGYKSEPLALTVARYDTRIDKPVVEDPTNVSKEVQNEIAKKLANLNHIAQDKVTINADGTVTINFEGVDPSLAPTLQLKDLVLKQLKEEDVKVPTGDKAVFVANPLAYSDAEIKSIKKAIYEANKKNDKLGLSDTDYEKQISLSYLTGDLTASGHANQGISNGQAENTITVKIKTDKAVAEFTSNVKENKLTRIPNIRTDYDVSWTKDKIDGRNSDEGLSWSEDKKTIIYRYDPTAAQEFDTNKILNLLTAKPKEDKSGLPTLTGGETLAHEGDKDNPQKSHVGYVLKDGQPTTELSLGNMDGAYWKYSRPVDNSGEKLGDNLSEAGSYSWDEDAKPVKVAAKKGKVYKARLFVLPYGMTMYRNIYIENGKNPWNTAKAINVIFVPQTNHKTKDLSDSIGEHKTESVDGKDVPTQSKYYNASKDKKDAYDKALAAAKKLYDSVKDTDASKLTEDQKADIDNATIKLNKARAELDGPDTDKTNLEQSINDHGKAKEGQQAASGTQATNQFKNVSDPDFKDANGNPDTKKNEDAKKAKEDYDKALEDAKTVNSDKNATQKAVDDAKAKLDEARKKLNDFTTNKDELNNAIAQHGHVNTGKNDQGTQDITKADPTYQNSSKQEQNAYDDAVAEANKVTADPNASQKEVNEAIKKLKDAKAALDKNATDKSPLDAAVQKTLDNDSNKHSVFYTNAAAKKDTDAAAKKAVEDYDKALAEAKRVLGDKNATKADVDKAKKDLEDAEKVLYAETYQTKTTDLAEAIADNFSGYLMPAYFNAFDEAQAKGKDSQAAKDFKAYNDAYHAAKDLMEQLKNPDSAIKQTEVDAVKNQLIEARNAIDKYATDTSKISAAVFNDIAIKNSPAYKNLKALAEKTNPTPEEQADVEAAKKAMEAYKKAADKLHNAITNKLPRDKANGQDIPDSNIPVKDGDLNDKDYLKDIQAHKNGEPLNRDVDSILQEMNEAAKALDKFKTKTDELIKSINEDATTHPSPAFKNASHPNYQKDDGSGADDTKNTAAKAAAEAYGKALAEAKAKLNDPAATQKDIDDAKTALDNARKELNKYNTDTTKLKESVDKNGKDASGTEQAVEGTKDSDAYRNASDPHFLNDQGQPDTKKNDEAKKAKADYDKALVEAQELLSKHNGKDTPQDAKPTQADIDAALDALDKARTKLDTYKTNAEALKTEADLSKADGEVATVEGKFENSPEFKNAEAKKGEDNKDNDDVDAYKKALKAARDLLAKKDSATLSDRPTQQQVDEALDALKKAKQTITDTYKTNVSLLKDAKELASVGFKNTPEYKNAVVLKNDTSATADSAKKSKAKAAVDALDKDTNNGALKKAIDILNKFDDDGKPVQGATDIPTQAQVDEALDTLQKAMKTVTDNFKTDVKPLQNEVGDKDEHGKDVIPPFEASVAYKNALEKAKTEDATTTDPNSATKKLEDYNKKLKAAQDLIAQVNSTDPNADPDKKPTQKQVDDALEALKKAKQDLADAFKTNASALKNEADDKDEHGNAKQEADKFENSTEFKNLNAKIDGDKKPDDLVAYEQALAKARELIKKNTGKMTDPQDPNKEVDVPKDQLPSQKEVDEALKNLKEIKEKIKKNYVTSPHDLQDEVDKSKDGEDDTSTDVFENTPAFKNATAKGDDAAKKALDAYTEKLKAARKLLGAFNRNDGTVKEKKDFPEGITQAPTQQDLDKALKELQEAKKKIEDEYSTIKYDLRQEAGKDPDFTKSPEYQNAQAKGDDASKQALEDYKKALDEANSVLDDPNATQAEVDAALKKLKAAKDKLRDENSTDKSKLQTEADADASFRKSVYFIIGNKADIEAYENALAEARSVLKDPNATQAQVDEALRKLQAAKDKLNHPFGIGSGSGIGSGYDPNAGDGFAVEISDSQSASVDKSALQIEVNNAVDTNANTAAARAYRQALAEARRVLADENATQAQVDAALRNLKAAKAALLNSLRGASGASGLKLAKTGAATGLFASIAAAFAGLGVAGVASRRRKHSNE